MIKDQISEIAAIANKTFPRDVSDIIESLELLNMALERLFSNANQKMKASADQKDFATCNDMVKLSFGISAIEDELKELVSSLVSFETEDDPQDDDVDQRQRDIPNYSMYEVDSSVPHTLLEIFTHKKPSGFLFNNKRYTASEWKDVLLQTCDLLAKINPEKFKSFLRDPVMKGRKIKYFGTAYVESKKAKMREMDVYVWTNLSANSIRNLIIKMLKQFGIEISAFLIYLRADYSALHEPFSKL